MRTRIHPILFARRPGLPLWQGSIRHPCIAMITLPHFPVKSLLWRIIWQMPVMKQYWAGKCISSGRISFMDFPGDWQRMYIRPAFAGCPIMWMRKSIYCSPRHGGMRFTIMPRQHIRKNGTRDFYLMKRPIWGLGNICIRKGKIPRNRFFCAYPIIIPMIRSSRHTNTGIYMRGRISLFRI